MKGLWLLALVLSTAPAWGQGLYFNARYSNDTTADQTGITSLVATASGYVTFGQAVDYPFLNANTLMLRGLDQRGQQQWVRYYGRPGYYYFSPGFGNGDQLRQPDGGFSMAGSVNAPQRQQWPMLWRFTAQGDTLWTQTYRQLPFGAVAYAGCRTGDGGYAVVGAMGRGTSGSGERALLVRTDSAGQLLWWQQYGTAYSNKFHTVYPTADGGLLLSGLQASSTASTPYVIKTDSLGTMQWERTFGALDREHGGATARPLRGGGYIVAATRYGGEIDFSTIRQPILYKLDSAGYTVWQRVIGPARYTASFLALHELADGAIVAAGQQSDADSAFTNYGKGYPEGFAVKVCADGDSLWFRTYKLLRGGFSHNYLRDFQPTPDGGFVGGGFLFALAPDVGSNDSWVFKVDSVGNLMGNGPGPDTTAVCYVAPPHPLGVAPAVGMVAVRVYPNPSASGHFTLAGAGGAEAIVVDALGWQVRRQTIANNEQPLDLSGAPPGLYLLRLCWPGGRTLTQRLMR